MCAVCLTYCLMSALEKLLVEKYYWKVESWVGFVLDLHR